VLVGRAKAALWDGKSAIQSREATAAQCEGSSLETMQQRTRQLTCMLVTIPMSGAYINEHPKRS